MARGRGGRPTKLSPEIHQRIVTAIQAGNYMETAAAFAGIDKSTLYAWLKRGAREKARIEATSRGKARKSEAPFVEFSNAVEKALAEAEVRDVTLIGAAAEKEWQAAAWRLERKFPKRWGRKDRVELTGEGGGPVAVTDPREQILSRITGIAARIGAAAGAGGSNGHSGNGTPV